jgi:hypothetical protein
VGAFFNTSIDVAPLTAAPVLAVATRECCAAPGSTLMTQCCIDAAALATNDQLGFDQSGQSYVGAAVTVAFLAAMRVEVPPTPLFCLFTRV